MKGKYYGNVGFEDFIKGNSQIPTEIYIVNKDLVFETEQIRVNTLDDVTINNNYGSSVIPNTSNKFKTYKTKLNNNSNLYKVRFISINNQYANSELKEAISLGIWFDDYNFIYSIEGKGIYLYNAEKRDYKVIAEGNASFRINSVDKDGISYDDSFVEVNVEN